MPITDPTRRRWIKDELQSLAHWLYLNRETNDAASAFHELASRLDESLVDIWTHLGEPLTPNGSIPAPFTSADDEPAGGGVNWSGAA